MWRGRSPDRTTVRSGPRRFAATVICACLGASLATFETRTGDTGTQEIVRSRYRLVGQRGALGGTDLTEFRRPDGSRSFLARERMEFWGPVLDRFVVLTFDPDRHFDSGHWVGTSAYSPAFTYTFRFDGRAVRGDWIDSVRGRGWTEVPSRPENPLVGFWGPLESRVLERFDPHGADRQTFDAVDVEDSHHRLLHISVERIGQEVIEVPAGRFTTTHFRSERFGPTDHWVDSAGTLIRWSSEQGTFHWDLERYPSADPLDEPDTDIATGTYDVRSASGSITGAVSWSLAGGREGSIHMLARESLNLRSSRFAGVLDRNWRWKETTETVRWSIPEGDGPAETHHLETFFYRGQVHLLRFRDHAYPLLQSREAGDPAAFYALDYPVSAIAWLRNVPRVVGREHPLRNFAHLANRYRGGGLEVQDARIVYVGPAASAAGAGGMSGHHFVLRYPGGWSDATSEIWTDQHFVPYRVKTTADEQVEYRLRDFRVVRERDLPKTSRNPVGPS